ncbi:MAG: type IV-A pilus assembly ATPase PilB [Deltaproteobacteria bacterium]|nr:MAG: type IV-A pilus assembly ATPase PilB [Deltaproteobacteria bacterium]
MAGKLGELLVKQNLITPEQLQKALAEQKISGGRLGDNLTRLGFIAEKELTGFLSKQYGVPDIDLSETEVDPEVVELIPEDVARKHNLLPVSRMGATLVVAMADPSNVFAIDDVKFLTGYNIEVVVASEPGIKEAIAKYYGSKAMDDVIEGFDDIMDELDDDEYEVIGDFEDLSEDELAKASAQAPVVKMVNSILMNAINKAASDIHVESYEKSFRIRLRIDGKLYEVMKPALKLRNAIVSRLKIMSQMDIAERRLPQDGRIKLRLGKEREMDFRVSALPCAYGEKVVLRLLDKSSLQLDMTKLGFEEEQLRQFKDAISQPYGMILVTGPTGSGKTTTLYSALSELNKPTVNISTAEDPVEYNLAGINQVQMHDEIGLNFAGALRSFLRQDPNVILVGEIRDFETAEIAVKAALTGQLVLSTLHTNDAASSVTRLVNMGIEAFLVSSSVNLIQAQRLVRRICPECKEQIEVPTSALTDIGISPEEAPTVTCFKGRGCNTCNNTGYKGRIAIYEIMPIDEELRTHIINGASDIELKKVAISKGMKSLRQSAISKMRDGVTTLDEVVSVTMADES